MARLTLALTLVVLALCHSARAQTNGCNLNPNGPDGLVLTVPQAGSDFDLGWKGKYHDLQVPAGAEFSVCLNDCDFTTDPICTVQGYAGGQQTSGRSFAPPIPVAIGSTAVCVVTTFREPFATGTANVQTGAIDVTAGLSADVYLTSLSAVCPVCSGLTPGDTGMCVGGANAGQACTTNEVITVQNATAGNPYRVSRDCLPSGGPLSTQFTVQVTTGTGTQSGLCAGQSSATDCGNGNSCGLTCSGSIGDGISQNCCSNNTAKRCFPDPLVRTGAAAAGSPAWPDTSYPKAGTGTLVSTFCAPAVPGILGLAVNGDVGLAGPAAFVLPIDAVWQEDPAPTSTTSTTVTTSTTTTTTLPPCTGPLDCSDNDICTADLCTTGICSNPPATGADAVICQAATLNAADVCGVDPVEPALKTAIASAVTKLTTALDASKTAPRKRAKALRASARKALAPLGKKATKAAKKGLMTTACRDALKSKLSAITQAIGGL